MSEWQPIETAPRDGTRIWAFSAKADPEQFVIYWEQWAPDEAGWGYAEHLVQDVLGQAEDVTHWMPLPAPPVTP